MIHTMNHANVTCIPDSSKPLTQIPSTSRRESSRKIEGMEMNIETQAQAIKAIRRLRFPQAAYSSCPFFLDALARLHPVGSRYYPNRRR